MEPDHGGCDGAGGVHGRAANGTGKHSLQRDDRANDDASGNAALAGTRGNAEDDEHEDTGKDKLENEGLRGRASRQGSSESSVRREQASQEQTRRKRAAELAGDVGQDLPPRKTARGEKADRHSGIEMCARDVAHRINHGEHDEAEGKRDADVRNAAAGNVVDDDSSRACKNEAEGAEKLCK